MDCQKWKISPVLSGSDCRHGHYYEDEQGHKQLGDTNKCSMIIHQFTSECTNYSTFVWQKLHHWNSITHLGREMLLIVWHRLWSIYWTGIKPGSLSKQSFVDSNMYLSVKCRNRIHYNDLYWPLEVLEEIPKSIVRDPNKKTNIKLENNSETKALYSENTKIATLLHWGIREWWILPYNLEHYVISTIGLLL